MTVITISRQLGSMGRNVAELVAQRLQYRFVWREIINEAARRACTPEVALATIDELGLLGLHPTARERKAYCATVDRVLQELAVAGSVVVLGRAGQVVLAAYPNTLHVRITAPVDVRVNRIMSKLHVPHDAALMQVEASDRHRREYLRRYYRHDWDDPALYDLVINTAHLDAPAAAEIIYVTAIAHFTHQADTN